jgi:siroheme synthase-like protein
LKSGNSRIYYPAFIDITGKKCLIIGGGKVAERKVAMLLRFGARIVVVSPVMSKQLMKLGEEGKIESFQRTYVEKDLSGTALVFACTDKNAINGKIRKDAMRKNIPVNVADDPVICDFIVPSIVRKGDLTIAISHREHCPCFRKNSGKRSKRLERTSIWPTLP